MKRFLTFTSFFLVIGLLACSKPLTYNDFTHISHWDDIQSFEDGTVLLYFYSPYCDICAAFEETMTSYAKRLEGHVPVYFANSSRLAERGTPNFETTGVPALFILHDREFVEMVRGLRQMEEALITFLP